MAAGQRKPEAQWKTDERKATNLDQCLKSLIMLVLPDDQINSVINCLTAKSTWDDLYHEGPYGVKESRVMDLKLCYNTFKFKEDSPNDEEDTRSIHEYLNDLEEEYQAKALLAKSKILFKKGTQWFSSAKGTDQTECHKCGKKGHFARDCWSKTLAPSYQSPFLPKLLISSKNKPEMRNPKDFEAKYNKVKAKLALLSSSASAPNSFSSKNKGLIAESHDWDKEEVSSDDEETEVKALMALTDEERISVGKESAKNGTGQLIEDTSNCGSKDLVFVKSLADSSNMSITRSNQHKSSEPEDFTLPNHDTDEVPSNKSQRNTIDPLAVVFDSPTPNYDLAPARGNKGSSVSKTNSAPAGKLKNVNVEDDYKESIELEFV
uniref:CCHC-type domain-containing protein n=1 Tax=Tanacetum cinerariifolium TaxID=118510 RepID=A0A6L2N4W4_TANCI|nr:hypothetical protein [Tanacetum cinerariifolium]